MMSLSEQTSEITHLEALQEKGIPLVFFDRIAEQIDAPKVTTDDYNCGIMATEHLLENGCKRVAFLTIAPNLSISNKRMNGYLDALKKHYIKPEEHLILPCTGDDNKNKELIRQLLSNPNRPDGIFASVEKLAISTYALCEELNLNIPEDLKVICFSNMQTAAFLNPSLSTIVQPAYEMGREAAAILFDLVEKKGRQPRGKKTVLNSILVERNSTK